MLQKRNKYNRNKYLRKEQLNISMIQTPRLPIKSGCFLVVLFRGGTELRKLFLLRKGMIRPLIYGVWDAFWQR